MDRFWRWCSYSSVIVGAWLRLAGLAASPLWYDETVSLQMARLPILQTVRGQAVDFSPPLNELIAWVSIRLFGDGEIGIRLPALAASMAALALAWQLARAFRITASGHALAVALAALLPYQIYLAQDGRVYAVMSMLYLAAVWFALEGRPAGLAAACGLMLYCHATGFFYVAAALALAAYVHRARLWTWVGCGLAAVAAWLPWLPSFLGSAGRHHWIDLTDPLLYSGLERSMFANSFTDPVWLVAAIMVIVASMAASVVIAIRHRELLSLALVALFPLALMLAVSPIKNVVLYRTLSPMAIPLVLLVAAALPRYTFTRAALVGNWIALAGLALAGWTPAGKGEGLRQVAAAIAADPSPGVVVYHASATSLLPFRELLPNHRHYLLDDYPAHTGLLSDELRDLFGLERRALAALDYDVAYIVWPLEPLLPPAAHERMRQYAAGGQYVGRVDYWQAATIHVWRVTWSHR